MIFASTSSIILRTFYCDQFGDDLNFYLVADKKIVCRFYNEEDETFTKNPEYAKLLRMALVGVGIYPLGIPLMYYYLLRKYKKILKHEDLRVGAAAKIVAPISFLWKMYEPEKWWFEVRC